MSETGRPVAAARRPVRVLHVLKDMVSEGGVESWLLQVARHMDREKFRMDLMVRSEEPSRFDAAFESLGVKVLRCVRPDAKWTYASVFRQIVHEHGPYDVIHCHTLFNRGYVLRLARLNHIPVRIAHSHNAPAESAGAVRRFRLGFRYLWMSPWWTGGLACSRPAARELFGPAWADKERFRLLYCGIDLAPFRQAVGVSCVRAELGIPPDAFVVGHVGRFEDQKNHPFLVEIAAAMAERHERVCFLLVGDGSTRPDIEQAVRERGFSDRVIFAGSRADVPRLMLGAMDAFVLPSLHEGLPLVGMEAQASGLPMLVSDAVTTEMDAVPGLVRRLPLEAGPEAWAEALTAMRRDGPGVSRSEALSAMERGCFNIHNSVSALQDFYTECLARHAG